jgi:hypothetical protein
MRLVGMARFVIPGSQFVIPDSDQVRNDKRLPQ